jgi:hypothetical protein
MSVKNSCLCLLLVLVSAWTDDLQAGTFVASTCSDTPLFGHEAVPADRFDRREAQVDLEIPSPCTFDLAEKPLMLVGAINLLTNQLSPQVFASSYHCFVLMSLQE